MNEVTTIEGKKSKINYAAREAILSFEEMLMQRPGTVYGDSDECPLNHTFCNGMYIREMEIPAGITLTGKIHKHEHPVFLMEGEILVATEDGVIHLIAPQYFISPPGVKRAARTLSDTVWVTIHQNLENITNLGKLEEQNISKSYKEFDNYVAKLEWDKKPFFKKALATIKKYLLCHGQQQ